MTAATVAKGTKHGQAPALSAKDRDLWLLWLRFVKDRATAPVYVALWLTFHFALRCREACRLRREDIRLDRTPPVVRARAGKTPGDIPITKNVKKNSPLL